jgi:outer membrane protein TolC
MFSAIASRSGLQLARRRGLAAGLLLFAAVMPVCAAETLQEAWAIALAQDSSLQAAHSRLRAADDELEAARAARQPAVTASSAITRFRDTPAFDFAAAGLPGRLPLFGGDTVVMSDAQASFPLYTAGMIGANIDAARSGLDAQTRTTAALAQQLKLAVATSYVGVLRTESALTAARTNAASLAAHARDVADMERNGQVPRNDYLAAAVSLADAQQRALQTETALDVARAVYNRQIGRALDAPVELLPDLPAIDAELAGGTLEDLVARALARRDELAGLAAVAAQLQAQSAATRAQLRPQLILSGGYTFLENDVLDREDYWSLGFGIRLSLFDGGRTRNTAGALMHRSSAAAQEHSHLQSLIELEVMSARLGLHETRQRIGVTESAILQAEENLRVVRDRYRNGEGTNTEVLDAEALRSLSRSNFDAAHYDAALAEFRLARAVGVL